MRVEWSVLEGGQTEALLATCVYIDHPRSNRIRPSQGDFGIDVLEPVAAGDAQFDVWQIKRFATNLGSSEKRQIEKSFRRVLLALVRRGVPLRHWHLVLPLDPTIENRMDWFAKMPAAVFDEMKADTKLALTDSEIDEIRSWLDDPTSEIRWEGLDFCESVVAAHPEVPDYFLHGGAQRLRDAVATLSGLLARDQLVRTDSASPSVLQPSEIVEHLRAVQTALDGDPHYRYGFQVEPHRNAVHPEPYLVAATQQTLPGGQTLTYRIYTRFDEAVNERPIPVRLQFLFDDPTFDRQAFEDWRDYGVEYNGPAAVAVGLPGGLDTASEGRVRIPASPSPTFQRRYRLATPDGVKITELMFNCTSTTGLSGKSARTIGVDNSGLVRVEFRGSLETDSAVVSFSAEPLDGVEVLRAVPVVRFLRAWEIGNRLQVAEPFGGKFVDIHPVPTAEELIHPLLASWIDALAEIQEQIGETILLPPLDQVTYRDLREALDAAAMLRGQTIVARWTEVEMSNLTPHLANGAAQLETEELLQIRVGSQTITIGTQLVTLLSAQLTTDGSTARAVPLDNDTAHRTYVGPGSPADPAVVRGRTGSDPTQTDA